jgi:phosphate transport system substrate-binding protein
MKKSVKKLVVSALGLALGVSMVAGCGSSAKTASNDQGKTEITGKVTASGSSALLPLLKIGQEEFMNDNTKVTVNISGGGSFTGQKQVAAGSVDIGNSDVAVAANLKDKGLVAHKLVGIPFVFITNKDNGVDSLTGDEYKAVLTGKITNWDKLGGKNQKITLIHRAKSSGSRATIAKIVLNNAEFTDDAIIQNSNGAVKSAIATTPGSIGYVDAAYLDDTVKGLKYNGVEYSIKAVTDGKYPVYTFGRMFTKGEAKGAVKAFIDYVTGEKFQNAHAAKMNFVPITSMKK